MKVHMHPHPNEHFWEIGLTYLEIDEVIISHRCLSIDEHTVYH